MCRVENEVRMAELKNRECKHQVNAMRVCACLIRRLCTVRYWFLYCFLLLRSTFVCHIVSMAVVNPFFQEMNYKHRAHECDCTCCRLQLCATVLIASGESIHLEKCMKQRTKQRSTIVFRHSIQFNCGLAHTQFYDLVQLEIENK